MNVYHAKSLQSNQSPLVGTGLYEACVLLQGEPTTSLSVKLRSMGRAGGMTPCGGDGNGSILGPQEQDLVPGTSSL